MYCPCEKLKVIEPYLILDLFLIPYLWNDWLFKSGSCTNNTDTPNKPSKLFNILI